MILRNGSETVKYQQSVKTGVHTAQGKYGPIKTTTSKTTEHTAVVSVYAEVNDHALNGMVLRACMNKSGKCVDGPVTVKVRKEKVLSSVEVPCRSCGKLHDYGVPCGDGPIITEVL